MEAVSYYRSLVYYFKKCLIDDEEGLAKIQNMDLVMMGVIVLAIISFVMYEVVNIIEKNIKRKRN